MWKKRKDKEDVIAVKGENWYELTWDVCVWGGKESEEWEWNFEKKITELWKEDDWFGVSGKWGWIFEEVGVFADEWDW